MQQANNDIITKKTPVPTRSWWQRLLALCLILALLLGGIAASKYLLHTKPKARKKAPTKEQTLVRTAQLEPITTNAMLHALGSVMPAKEIQLMAQVSGQVLYVHPNLEPGGIVRKGETLVRLDDRDYQITLKQRQNALAKAKADLQIEQGSQVVAQKEWDVINQLNDDIDPSSQDLALRKPQLSKAQNTVSAAKTDIEKAALDLSRTQLQAPFDAVVTAKNINLGSQVSSQSNIATLVGIDVFWAEISLSMDKLPWLDLPSATNRGSEVTVYSSLKTPYKGRIVSLLPELENNGLMARLLIEIEDPMRLRQADQLHVPPPLPLGSHIEAEITGKIMPRVFQVPRAAVQDGHAVFTVSEGNTLKTQPVSILWKSPEWVYIDSGLTPESQVIVSNVPTPVEGMPLKIFEDTEPALPPSSSQSSE
jgi:RND family efflux transporter MFP subunit